MNSNMKITLLGLLLNLFTFFMVIWLRFATFVFGVGGSFAKQNILISPLYLGYLITVVGASLAFLLGIGKSKKRKYRIWGMIVMLPISLPLSYSIGITYAFIAGNPWATLFVLYVFPAIFILGLFLLLAGIFRKEKVHIP